MSHAYPKVIACGHRQVCVKSGCSFPAFLIRFPSISNKSSCEGDCETCNEPSLSYVYFWRTKLDFLLLNRSIQKYDSTKSFPKSAFSKLCYQALNYEERYRACVQPLDNSFYGPWVRPDDGEAPPEGFCGLVKSLLISEINDEVIGETRFLFSNFNPKMKKSLHQLDSFLLEVQNIHRFQLHKGVIDAWFTFCREQDSENLIFLNTLIVKEPSFELVDHRKFTDSAVAAKLGQYFASKQSAEDIINKAMELLVSVDGSDSGVIFLEPSCGDGRVILELLNSQSSKLKRAQIIGYDIDPNAIEKSRTTVDMGAILLCKDFLSLSRGDLLFDISQNITAEETFENDFSSSKKGLESRKLVVFGGPPYTPKHLPRNFILHSIKVLNAEIIVFILPKRCQKEAVEIQKILNIRNEAAGGSNWWCFRNKELANSTFSFQDRIVYQPSILQYWYKVKKK